MTKYESVGVFMMLKIGMEVDQDCTVLYYGPSRPQKDLKSQDRIIVAGTGFNLA